MGSCGIGSGTRGHGFGLADGHYWFRAKDCRKLTSGCGLEVWDVGFLVRVVWCWVCGFEWGLQGS